MTPAEKKSLSERDTCTKVITPALEELPQWCGTLEAQLHQTRTLGAHLLDSTLHHHLAA